MPYKVKLIKLRNSKYKYKAIVHHPSGRTATVNFGASAYSDFTKHKNEDRKRRYIARHRRRERWDKRGIDTAGFWSRWLLWNKPSIRASKRFMRDNFEITFI